MPHLDLWISVDFLRCSRDFSFRQNGNTGFLDARFPFCFRHPLPGTIYLPVVVHSTLPLWLQIWCNAQCIITAALVGCWFYW